MTIDVGCVISWTRHAGRQDLDLSPSQFGSSSTSRACRSARAGDRSRGRLTEPQRRSGCARPQRRFPPGSSPTIWFPGSIPQSRRRGRPGAVADGISSPPTAASSAVLANDTDIDGGPKTVAKIGDTSVAAGGQVTLASGAKVTLNADGTLTYAPSGAVAAGASDSFVYALNGGSQANVGVRVFAGGESGRLIGTAEGELVQGGSGAETFDLSQGGDGRFGRAGNGPCSSAAFDGWDRADGGEGTTTLVLQGIRRLALDRRASPGSRDCRCRADRSPAGAVRRQFLRLRPDLRGRQTSRPVSIPRHAHRCCGRTSSSRRGGERRTLPLTPASASTRSPAARARIFFFEAGRLGRRRIAGVPAATHCAQRRAARLADLSRRSPPDPELDRSLSFTGGSRATPLRALYSIVIEAGTRAGERLIVNGSSLEVRSSSMSMRAR